MSGQDGEQKPALSGSVTRTLSTRVTAFGTNKRGTVAIIFALAGTTLIGIVGGGIDYARLMARRTELQSAVDTGALAGGNALKLASSDPAAIIGLTEQTIRDAA